MFKISSLYLNVAVDFDLLKFHERFNVDFKLTYLANVIKQLNKKNYKTLYDNILMEQK